MLASVEDSSRKTSRRVKRPANDKSTARAAAKRVTTHGRCTTESESVSTEPSSSNVSETGSFTDSSSANRALERCLSFKTETSLYEQKKADVVVGVDEVGRGCLAGPVVACACYISPTEAPKFKGVQDSKALDEPQREHVYSSLSQCSNVFFETSQRSPEDIDSTNILNETLEAMTTAVEALLPRLAAREPHQKNIKCHVLVDGNRVPPRLRDAKPRTINNSIVTLTCEPYIKGDAHVFSIAAASILAKVTRDRQLNALALQHPAYGFERHKGYATSDHVEAIQQSGVLAVHRLTFRPICSLLLADDTLWPKDRVRVELDPVERRRIRQRQIVQERKPRVTPTATLDRFLGSSSLLVLANPKALPTNTPAARCP